MNFRDKSGSWKSLAVLLAFCISAFTPPLYAQSPRERVTIRYGYLPIPVMPLFSARVYKLLEQEGIDLQLIKFTSGPAEFQALQSGSIDTAQGSLPAFYMGYTRGLDAKWIYSFGNYGPLEALVIPKGSAVRDLKDLRGKKVTAPSGTILNLAHLYSLNRAGLTTEDVQFVPLQPPQAMAAILNGDVDAAWLWEPFISNVVEKGGRVIASNKTLGLLSPFGIAANSKWLQDKRNVDALGRMLHAFDEGQRRFLKEREPTLAEIKAVTGIERDLSTKIIDGIEWYTVADQLDAGSPISLANPTDLQSGASFLLKDKYEETALKAKMIEKRGDIPGFIDNRPARAAIGK